MPANRFFKSESTPTTVVVELQKGVNDLADADMMDELDRLVQELQKSSQINLLVDFHELNYFGSSVLEALRVLWNRVSETHGTMALCCVSEVGNDIIRVAKFDTLWQMYESRDEGLQALDSGK